MQMSGSVMELSLTPTRLWYCQPYSETWTEYQRHAKRFNHFHLSCLRKLLKIKWQDKIPDTEVLKKVGMQSVYTVLKLAQLRWTGHVMRTCKKVFYGELHEGKCSQGWPEETPQSLSEGFRHTNVVFGTDCPGAIKVARSHQQRSSSL